MTGNRNFQVIAKPNGPLCNLACSYCFYLEKEVLFDKGAVSASSAWTMSDAVLETYISQKLASSPREQHFLWQGGEPTLLGLGFFEKVVALQAKYGADKRIHNAIQTNGLLLDDAWCQFLAENHFLVGISIDGPREIHDRYRLRKSGRSSFDQTLEAVGRLQAYGVDFNTLTTVHAGNQQAPLEVYAFLKELGARYQQYIPIVERVADPAAFLPLARPDVTPLPMTKWSVGASAYGEFLIRIFDEWVKNDVGRIFVQNFDVALEAWLGRPSSLCIFQETCGQAPALEHTGDLYACDHFVYPDFKVGNILQEPLEVLMTSPMQLRFGNNKRDKLPKICRDCSYRFACHGGCPKQRFIATPESEHALSYLCPSYIKFFEHIDPALRFMANEIKERRPPSNIMQTARYGGPADENHP